MRRLLRGAEAAHRLALYEIATCGDRVVERIVRSSSDGVATVPDRSRCIGCRAHVVGRHRLRQTDDAAFVTP